MRAQSGGDTIEPGTDGMGNPARQRMILAQKALMEAEMQSRRN